VIATTSGASKRSIAALYPAPPAWENTPVPRTRTRASIFAVVTALSTCAALVPHGDAGADAGDAGREGGSGIVSRTPPDPPPLSERFQWVFDLRWERGDVFLVAVHKIDQGTPKPTPRVMGRFALELYEGPTLIERVRFDFPMLGGAPEIDAGFDAPPRFEPKLKTRIGVLFPATTRGTRLELWDRAKDQRWPLPWPPKEGVVGVDAGS
jgi:hypothetical protein